MWPLESRNFFNSLVQNPGSTGGTIEQIALSPLGGDANQKAEFLNSKVRIISETRNGFVQRHKIEIIGRISVFWHWAKYVVVYERTVNPSAQFTPDGGIGQRTRRPVLRKVSEYIYIRQPQGIRRFPDFPTADSSTTGPLNAVKFNSVTINVDSAWSEDVGEYGWIIPLWNRAAALRRPQVYPRPDIAFSTAAEGQGDEAVTSQECIEPDNIYFYADASPNTSEDTDTWPSQFGIDCSRLTPPTDQFQRPLGTKNTDGTQTQPGAARIPRGHRRFTWRLAPPAKKTALNAGRSSKPIYAGLESITFMRSKAQDADTLIGSPPIHSSALPYAVQSADKVTRPAADPLPIWHKGDYPGPRQSPPGAFGDVSDALKGFLVAAKAARPNVTAIGTAVTRLKAALTGIRSALQSDPTLSKYAKAAKANANALRTLKEFATSAPQQCQQLADDFVGSIKRKELLVLDAITTWENHIDALPLVGSPPMPITREFLVEQLRDSLNGQIAAVMSGVSTDIGRVEAGIERARDVLHDFQNQLAETGDDLRLKLAGFKAAYDDGKPWSDARITELQTKLAAERARAFHAVETLAEEARVRLTSELDGFARGVANVLQQGIEDIVTGGSELQQRLAGSWNLVSVYLQRVEDFLDGEEGLESKLADLQAEVNASPLGNRYDRDFDRIAGLVRVAEQDLQSAQWTLTHQESNASAAISAALAESVKQLQTCVDAITSVTAATTDLLDALARSIDTAAIDTVRKVIGPLADLETQSLAILTDFGTAFDSIVDQVVDAAVGTLNDVSAAIAPMFQQLDDEGQRLASQVDRLRQSIGPDAAVAYIDDHVLGPALESVLSSVTVEELSSYTQEVHDRIRGLIAGTSTSAQNLLENLTDEALGDAKNQVVSMCNLVGAGFQQGFDFLDDMESAVQDRVDAITKQLDDLVAQGQDAVQQIQDFADGFAADVRQINNDIATSYASAKGYGNRVLEAAGNLGTGGIGAVPGSVLRLYAAVASAPALPNLDFARDRLGYYYNHLNQVIDTTPAEAWFGRLGDELKALGLSIPFSQMGDRILPDVLSNFDISRIFKNFSGMKLDKLFDGYKLPPGATDAIKITHAFDKAQARAWVEIDVDLPMPDRKAMFSIGPFELDYVNSHFLAMVRLEASKDTDKVDEIGRAALTTDFEAVVSGQTMVSFQQVALRYDKSSGGLKVDFDPKRIRLNAIFQFIQDTLGSIFPDEIGGLTVIKDNGIPVGIEHVFAMPPIDLDFATSGVTNITISNTFGLVAYPEFMIFDRFALSRPGTAVHLLDLRDRRHRVHHGPNRVSPVPRQRADGGSGGGSRRIGADRLCVRSRERLGVHCDQRGAQIHQSLRQAGWRADDLARPGRRRQCGRCRHRHRLHRPAAAYVVSGQRRDRREWHAHRYHPHHTVLHPQRHRRRPIPIARRQVRNHYLDQRRRQRRYLGTQRCRHQARRRAGRQRMSDTIICTPVLQPQAYGRDPSEYTVAVSLNFAYRTSRYSPSPTEAHAQERFEKFLQALPSMKFRVYRLAVGTSSPAHYLEPAEWNVSEEATPSGATPTGKIINWLSYQQEKAKAAEFWVSTDAAVVGSPGPDYRINVKSAELKATHFLGAAAAWPAPLAQDAGLVRILTLTPALASPPSASPPQESPHTDVPHDLRQLIVVPFFDEIDDFQTHDFTHTTYPKKPASFDLIQFTYDAGGGFSEMTAEVRFIDADAMSARGLMDIDNGFLIAPNDPDDADNVATILERIQNRSASLFWAFPAIQALDWNRTPRHSPPTEITRLVWRAMNGVATLLDPVVMSLIMPAPGDPQDRRIPNPNGPFVSALAACVDQVLAESPQQPAVAPDTSPFSKLVEDALRRNLLLDNENDAGKRNDLVKLLIKCLGIKDNKDTKSVLVDPKGAVTSAPSFIWLLMRCYVDVAPGGWVPGLIEYATARFGSNGKPSALETALSNELAGLAQQLQADDGIEQLVLNLLDAVGILDNSGRGIGIDDANVASLAISRFRTRVSRNFNALDAVRYAQAQLYELYLVKAAASASRSGPGRTEHWSANDLEEAITQAGWFVQRIDRKARGIFERIARVLPIYAASTLATDDAAFVEYELKDAFKTACDDLLPPPPGEQQRFVPDAAPRPLQLRIGVDNDLGDYENFVHAYSGLGVLVRRFGRDWSYANLATLATYRQNAATTKDYDEVTEPGSPGTNLISVLPLQPAVVDDRYSLFLQYDGLAFTSRAFVDTRAPGTSTDQVLPFFSFDDPAAADLKAADFTRLSPLAYGVTYDVAAFVIGKGRGIAARPPGLRAAVGARSCAADSTGRKRQDLRAKLSL
ncbi:hypothetical protein ACVWXL_008911 [Bradyrhizobium sp. GM22.5]